MIEAFLNKNLNNKFFNNNQHAYIHVYAVDQIRRYRKNPKFSDARKFCCNVSKVQILRSFHRKYFVQSADGMTNSVDPDQTAPLGAV